MKKFRLYLKGCPLFAAVSVLTILISVFTILSPSRGDDGLHFFTRSVFSQRYADYLADAPQFTFKSWLDGSYARSWDEYMGDHLYGRDNWLQARSFAEFLMLKTENNGVAYGRGGYLFDKFYGYDANILINNVDAIDIYAYNSVTNVHMMVVPSAASPLIDYLPEGMPVSDQSYYIEQINTYLSGTSTVVNAKNDLIVNADKYVYYRTDPHWTTYGAYLAYSQYCSVRGIRAAHYNTDLIRTVNGYYGANYSKSKAFNVKPDVIEYFDYPGSVTFDGVEHEGLYDLKMFEGVFKYSAFLHGSHAEALIKGEESSEKMKSILVISDSFAYSFIPFLTQNYNEVTLIDLRFYLESLQDIRATQYDDALILLGFDALCTNPNLAKIAL